MSDFTQHLLQEKLDSAETKLGIVTLENQKLRIALLQCQRQHKSEVFKLNTAHQQEKDQLQEQLRSSQMKVEKVSSEQRKLEKHIRDTNAKLAFVVTQLKISTVDLVDMESNHASVVESEKATKEEPAATEDEKTPTAAKIDHITVGNQSKENNGVPKAMKTPPKPIWVPAPECASMAPPESTVGMRKCRKCDTWLEFVTNFEKETFYTHEEMCEDTVCRHEGCGDVMRKEHFHDKHRQACKARSVSEKKALSHTEALKRGKWNRDFDILTADGVAKKIPVGKGVDNLAETLPKTSSHLVTGKAVAKSAKAGAIKDQTLPPQVWLRPARHCLTGDISGMKEKKKGGLMGKSVWSP